MPRIYIGPQWYCTILLVITVLFMLYLTIGGMVRYAHYKSYVWLTGGALIFLFAIYTFTMTILMDPGIPRDVLEMKTLPNERHPNQDLPLTDKETGYKLCQEGCYVYKSRNIDHCEFCDVCVYDVNNHCCFFSKCIGKGNILHWRMCFVATILNLTYWIFSNLIVMSYQEKEDYLASSEGEQNLD